MSGKKCRAKIRGSLSDCADSSKHSNAMPSIGVSVYYRQSSKILRILRSFNLVVRCDLRFLCGGGGVIVTIGFAPIAVAAAVIDLEY